MPKSKRERAETRRWKMTTHVGSRGSVWLWLDLPNGYSIGGDGYANRREAQAFARKIRAGVRMIEESAVAEERRKAKR